MFAEFNLSLCLLLPWLIKTSNITNIYHPITVTETWQRKSAFLPFVQQRGNIMSVVGLRPNHVPRWCEPQKRSSAMSRTVMQLAIIWKLSTRLYCKYLRVTKAWWWWRRYNASYWYVCEYYVCSLTVQNWL